MRVVELIVHPSVVLGGLMGILAGIGGFAFYEDEGAAYLGDHSRTCANCHVMNDYYDGWQKASHQAHASCNDRHVPQGFASKYLAKGLSGFSHSQAFTLQNFREPIRIKPSSAKTVERNCARCHADLAGPMLAQAARVGEPGTEAAKPF